MKSNIMLIALLLILSPSALALDTFYNATMTYNQGKITLDSIRIVPLQAYDEESYRTIKEYSATVKQDGEVEGIYYFDFDLSRHAVIDRGNGLIESEDITLDKNTVSIYIPHNEGATEITLRDRLLEEVMTIPLAEVPEQKAQQIVPEEKQSSMPLNYILVALAVLLLLVVIWFLVRKKE